ncbi:coiled-coil domain-containing protein 39 [Sitodiplosis mosellana]|uniref:coiled-coil domain-containing protein 39 n=1 Tax=Sitodiplosis mosellana TaxID=263140 RepID=UPI0024451322|nr:coiled-coil domain-containing protein 39 [Sitodiplosis mosellana]
MSDSDDTDILLLIPPNFFLTETNESPTYDMFRSNLEQPTVKTSLSPRRLDKSTNQSPNYLLSHSKDLFVTPPQLKYRPYNEPSPTMNLSHCNRSIECERLNCIRPTECDPIPTKSGPNLKASSPLRRSSLNRDFERIEHFSSKKMSDWKTTIDEPRQHDDLVSLTNVWNNNLDFRSTTNHSTELEEERLRRRQCERNISSLQSQLNQYQNKFTDVIKIDQAKNDTIAKLHDTNSSLIANINELEKQISEMELRYHREKDQFISENGQLKTKVDYLKQQNDELDRKLSSILKSTNEVRDIHREQMNEMEIRLSNSKQSETILIDEISKLKNDYITKTAEHEAEQSRSQQLIDNQAMKLERLEQEITELKESNTNLQTKEAKFLEEMESQRAALKVFYQTQLDDLVRAKVEEYQKQFDSMERSIRRETKQNERIIAERALKQIELLTQKNEQEFLLLEEKHREEMELCKIRLGNATKIIAQLEQELSVYRAKRSDIAERLHNVIETQWQKTLEILTTNDAPKDSNTLTLNRIVNTLEKCDKNNCSSL